MNTEATSITVAINTWNRCDLLDATLGQMRKLTIPDNLEVRFLIVDNNSSDNTKSVVLKHSAYLPIQYVFEPKQGTAYAKNTVLDHATGDLLLWTDDDVIVDPNWIITYLDASDKFPDATIFGGTVKPMFVQSPPSWLVNNLDILGPTIAVVDRGQIVRKLRNSELVTGANMAFRTSAVKNYRFNTGLGDVGGKIRKGEETELIERMRADGHQCVWVGTSVVEHHVPVNRMTLAYIDQWFEASGSTIASLDPPPMGPFLFGLPRYMWRLWLTNRLSSLWHFVVHREVSIQYRVDRAKLRGAMRQARIRMKDLRSVL